MTPHLQSPPLARLIVWALLALLTACAAPPPKPQVEPAPPRLDEAEARLQAGDAMAAADLYLEAAESAEPDAALAYRLRAADILITADNLQAAQLIVGQIQEQTLSELQAWRLRLLRARLSLSRNQPEAALEQLGITPPAGAGAESQIRYHRLRARAYALLGNHLESARERIWLDGLLMDDETRRVNQETIVRTLSRLSSRTLQELQPVERDGLKGWMELVLLGRQYRDDARGLQQALQQWRDNYPDHPANLAAVELLAEQAVQLGTYPRQVAVLLPLSGRLAAAGEAIRNGLMTAYFAMERDQAPTLRFYDVGDETQRSWSLYQQAVQEGADFVIGPLAKEAVAELGRSGTLEVPVLSLNWLPEASETYNPQLFQFSLAPEDEARQVAERAYRSGKRRALAMIPEGDWGERVFTAFLERWETLGGDLLEVQYYGNEPRGLSERVKTLLNLDSSYNRRSQLTRLLGRQLEFEPRRRQDAEFVFLLAQPRDARLLRPLFRFHRAPKLPLYATSHVYTGIPHPERDRDMDGLKFCDIPFVLLEQPYGPMREQIQQLWPESSQRYPRLYAFAHDALNLVPYLTVGQSGDTGFYRGATGVLTLDAAGRLHRELRWARMENGRPVVLETLASPAGIAGDATVPPATLTDENDAREEQPTYPRPGNTGRTDRPPVSAPAGTAAGQPEL